MPSYVVGGKAWRDRCAHHARHDALASVARAAHRAAVAYEDWADNGGGRREARLDVQVLRLMRELTALEATDE